MRANLYQATPNGVIGGLTCGQWVKVTGQVKPSRFVRYNADGTAFLVSPTGRGRKARVNMQAFRLACGKSLAQVISTANVNGRVVKNSIDGDSTEVTPKDVIDLLTNFM